MDLTQLLLLQIIAHLLADFNFQPQKWSDDKGQNGYKSKYFTPHIIIVFITSSVLSFQWRFIPFALGIALLHIAIDAYKKKISNITLGKIFEFRRFIFFIDQGLHLLVIGITVYFFYRFIPIETWINCLPDTRLLLIILAYLICTKFSNILIKVLLQIYGIQNPFEKVKKTKSKKSKNAQKEIWTDLPNAGKIIGISERIIALTLILLHQFAAVGLLIAAKSILRFKEDDSAKAEYVLVGTILSFAIATIVSALLLITG